MKSYERVLTDEEVAKAEENGVLSLFSESALMGYGVYGAKIIEKDGKKVLWYEMGDSCD